MECRHSIYLVTRELGLSGCMLSADTRPAISSLRSEMDQLGLTEAEGFAKVSWG